MKTKTAYQITIGYKAVVCISVKANTPEEAKKKAVEIMKTQRDKMYKKYGVDLQDDSFAAHGCIDMDATWNMVQN